MIKDHTRFPCTASSTGTWDILNFASEDPPNTANIVDVYKDLSLVKQGGGNNGAAGHGCASSVLANGAVLKAIETASPDMLVLTSSQMLASALSIFLQGDAPVAGGVVFGDGVRCAGGQLLRLGVQGAGNGTAQYPDKEDLSIKARSQALGAPITAGATCYYQTYYRDPSATFCPNPPGNTWNVSNGVTIVWP